MKKPVMLMILDGFGLTDNTLGNAVKAANLPNERTDLVLFTM